MQVILGSAGLTVVQITNNLGGLPGPGVIVPPLAGEEVVTSCGPGSVGQTLSEYDGVQNPTNSQRWNWNNTGAGTLVTTTDVVAGVCALRAQLTVGVAYARQAATIIGTGAAGQAHLAFFLGRFIAGGIGGGILARGARIRASVYRTVELAGQADVFVGWRNPDTAAASGMFGFEASDAQATWHCIVRDTGGAALIDVDSGIAVASAHTLDLRVGSQTNAQPYAQWIINGVQVAVQTGTIAGWAPAFPDALEQDWAPMIGCEKRAPSPAEVSLWNAVNDTNDFSFLPV